MKVEELEVGEFRERKRDRIVEGVGLEVELVEELEVGNLV